MGKKTKRSRRSVGGGSVVVAAAGAGAGGSALGINDNTTHRQKATDDDVDVKVEDDAIVSESEISHQPNQSHQTGELEEDRRRLPPALRSATGKDHENDDNEMCEEEDDEYEDMYEDEGDEDSYEDVYESSGDEDEDGVYEESMLLDNDGVAGSGTAPIQKKLPPININDGSNPPPAKIKTWNPFLGRSNNNGDGGGELEMDETAYKMHHALTPEWPSLTLDIIPDKHFGEHRTRFPHVITMVVGSSQSENSNKNKIDVLRMSDLCRMPGSGREKTEKELDDEMLGEEWKHEDEDDGEESDDDDDDEEEEEQEEELDPILEHYSFPHPTGGVNRVRVCPQNTDIVAVWSDGGVVSLYDIGGALDLLDRSSLLAMNKKKSSRGGGGVADGNAAAIMGQHVRKMCKEPFFVYSGHSTEGYAMDWSRVTPGRLATADCDGNIHIWNATHPVVNTMNDDAIGKKHSGSKPSRWGNSSFTVAPTYSAHGDNIDNPSVEDIQWSPTEATVLATAECGGYVRIYDIRCPGKAMISNKVHASGADVNVISWNRLVGNLLASGGDDGTFSVWDLRNFQTPDPSTPPKPLARFQSHRTPITSLEWHPTDESMIAVSDDHGTYIYDLSVEEDDPDQHAKSNNEEMDWNIPPQLLFVHSGSEMTKEVRWHPQIPSCVATTSLSGFSVFIPSNL